MIPESSITVGIKSFLRPDALQRTLKALEHHEFAAVIVADDSRIDEAKQSVLDEASRNIKCFRFIALPDDVGLSAGRNEIVRQCRSAYVLMLDDDQEVPDDIAKLGEILTSDREIGGVSCFWREFGRLKCTATNLIDKGPCIAMDYTARKYLRTDSGIRFSYADFVPNSTLFRIDCLRDVGWDPRFKIGSEHLDFYLAHKRLGKWKFAFTPDVVIEHFPKRSGEYSKSFRHNAKRLQRSQSIFNDKWNKQHIIRGQQVHPVSRTFQRKVLHFLMRIHMPLRAVGFVDVALRRVSRIGASLSSSVSP